MYPETDVPPIQISEEYLNSLRARLPELPERKLKRLMEEYKLNEKLARQVLDSEYALLFEEIARESGVSPTTIAVVLTETMKALRREGVEVDRIRDEQIKQLFVFLGSGRAAKEAVPDILTWLSKHEDASVEDAIESLGLTMLSEEEITKIVENVLEENRKSVEEWGKAAFGMLMGLVMRRVRGRASAELVNRVLRRKLEEFVS
jgi:glutamyl-tRNA(Gln) amidotransferase subunit E